MLHDFAYPANYRHNTKAQLLEDIHAELTLRHHGIPTRLTAKFRNLPKARIVKLHAWLYLWRNDVWHLEKCELFDLLCEEQLRLAGL